MKKSMLVLVCVGLFVAVAGAGLAFDGVAPGDPFFALQMRVFGVIRQYWQDVETLQVRGEEPRSDFTRISRDLAEVVVQAIRTNDHDALRLIAGIYQSLPEAARTPLAPALTQARAELAQDDAAGLALSRLRDYFPGYGYGEPGYKYRKGLELKREAKGTTWQEEEHTYSTSKEINLTVSIDLLGLLKKWLGGGLIKNLVIGEPYHLPFNGSYSGGAGSNGIVVNVTFSSANSITTKVRRKYEVNRIWFELLRSVKSGWGSSDEWAACGQTYEIIQDPTGDEFVVDMSPVGDVPVPTDPGTTTGTR